MFALDGCTGNGINTGRFVDLESYGRKLWSIEMLEHSALYVGGSAVSHSAESLLWRILAINHGHYHRIVKGNLVFRQQLDNNICVHILDLIRSRSILINLDRTGTKLQNRSV